MVVEAGEESMAGPNKKERIPQGLKDVISRMPEVGFMAGFEPLEFTRRTGGVLIKDEHGILLRTEYKGGVIEWNERRSGIPWMEESKYKQGDTLMTGGILGTDFGMLVYPATRFDVSEKTVAGILFSAGMAEKFVVGDKKATPAMRRARDLATLEVHRRYV